MKKNEDLTTYWITFPNDTDMSLPLGIGVTAYSLEDAMELIEQQGITWHKEASEINIKEGVTISDLDERNIVPNIGPMQFRGVWCPCQNIGYGAPEDNEFNPIK
ncbi:MAG: hypothetical protein AAF304_05535 [Pseudomonadota bacterium]